MLWGCHYMIRSSQWNRSGQATPQNDPGHMMVTIMTFATRQPARYSLPYMLRFEAYLLDREKSTSTMYMYEIFKCPFINEYGATYIPEERQMDEVPVTLLGKCYYEYLPLLV